MRTTIDLMVRGGLLPEINPMNFLQRAKDEEKREIFQEDIKIFLIFIN